MRETHSDPNFLRLLKNRGIISDCGQRCQQPDRRHVP
jgi:hypothetical protein